MMARGYFYARNGQLIGSESFDNINNPPELVNHDGRSFRLAGRATEYGEDEEVIVTWDYWEEPIESIQMDVVTICVLCGRNASLVWWKCCPEHCTETGFDVICQACVEKIHPGDEEFARE